VLEGYQHHALTKIGQPSNVEEERRRPRKNQSSSQAEVNREEEEEAGRVEEARRRAGRTVRWLENLPRQAARVSMRGMGLGYADAVVTAEHVKRGGRSLEEMDLKNNDLDLSSMQVLLPALGGCSGLKGLALGDNPIFTVRARLSRR